MKSEGTIRGSTSRIMRRLDNAWRRWRGAQRTGDRSETWSWRWNTPKAGTEESSEVVKMLNGSTSLDRTVDRLEDDVVDEKWLFDGRRSTGQWVAWRMKLMKTALDQRQWIAPGGQIYDVALEHQWVVLGGRMEKHLSTRQWVAWCRRKYLCCRNDANAAKSLCRISGRGRVLLPVETS